MLFLYLYKIPEKKVSQFTHKKNIEHHIRVISEGSCDTEVENSALHHVNKLYLKDHTQTDNFKCLYSSC